MHLILIIKAIQLAPAVLDTSVTDVATLAGIHIKTTPFRDVPKPKQTGNQLLVSITPMVDTHFSYSILIV